MIGKTVLKFVGRTLIGASIGDLGRQALMTPGGRVDMAEGTLDGIRQVVPIPFSDETVVRINGGVQAASGAMLSLGIRPKLAATAMLGSLIPTTQAGHAFWKIDDPAQRATQKTQFMKNLAIMGGLVYIIAAD